MPRFKLDFRLLDVRAELPALRDSVATLERQLEFIAAQRKRQVEADIAELGPDPDPGEVQLALQELAYEVEHTYPRVYRGSLLTVMWATYESAIVQVAEFLQRKKGLDIALVDVRGAGVVERARRYFRKALHCELYTGKDRQSDCARIYLVRNVFAHVNGRLAGVKDNQRSVIENMVEDGALREDLGYVVPTKEFLEFALDVIDGEVKGLVERTLKWDDERGGEANETVLL